MRWRTVATDFRTTASISSRCRRCCSASVSTTIARTSRTFQTAHLLMIRALFFETPLGEIERNDQVWPWSRSKTGQRVGKLARPEKSCQIPGACLSRVRHTRPCSAQAAAAAQRSGLLGFSEWTIFGWTMIRSIRWMSCLITPSSTLPAGCVALPQPRSRMEFAAETRAAGVASSLCMILARTAIAVRVWLRAKERIEVRAFGIQVSPPSGTTYSHGAVSTSSLTRSCTTERKAMVGKSVCS